MSIYNPGKLMSREFSGQEPNYDVSQETSFYLTKKLLEEQKDIIPADQPFVLFRIKGSSEFANIARGIEGEVFSSQLKDDPIRMKEDFAPYESSSYFFLVVDKQNEVPAGTLRVIEDNINGFMTLNETLNSPYSFNTEIGYFDYDTFFTDHNAISSETWEVGTIAVLPQYRRSATSTETQNFNSFVVSGLLYNALYAGAVNNDIKLFISMIDPEAHSTLTRLGIPFTNIYDLDLKRYDDGSEFILSKAYISEFESSMRNLCKVKISLAGSDEKNKAKAEMLEFFVDRLLTGYGLNDMMSFEHNNISINSVN